MTTRSTSFAQVVASKDARTTRSGDFWVPGEVVEAGGQHFQHGPLYVRWEAPERDVEPLPVILVHGGAVQGTEWMDTPDGRPGWAERLVDRGYAVLVVDRPTQGRSPLHAAVDGEVGPAFSYEDARAVFFPDGTRAEHTQWPIAPDDHDTLDAFVAAYGPLLADTAAWQRMDADRLARLLDCTGPAIVFTHSASGSDGWLLADARPDLVAAIVTVEPMGPPFGTTPGIGTLSWGLTAAPLSYEPAQGSPQDARTVGSAGLRVPALTDLPVAVVTGQVSPQAGYAPQIVQFLRDVGAAVDLLHLPDLGIAGNGHGLIYERNSDAALAAVIAWLNSHVHSSADDGTTPEGAPQ